MGESFDILALSYNTEGFSLGALKETILEVLTPQRIERLSLLPLSAQEFVEPLVRKDYLTAETFSGIKDFIWQVGGYQEKQALKEKTQAQNKKK